MRTMLVLIALAGSLLAADASAYDPTASGGKVDTRLTSFIHGGREVPLKIYLPEKKHAAVILLSHGLGGSREVGTYLGTRWAARGFVVVAMQHAGSDESVWKGVPAARRMAAMKDAASGANMLVRTRDVTATLDQLERWNVAEGHFLKGRLDLEHVGMAGHSFGAVTTQAVAGQSFGAAGAKFADPRIDAALALSPSVPRAGDPKRAFGGMKLPMMLMTGTKDDSVIGGATAETRREVYQALPEGSKYELVLKDAEHMAFSDRTARGGEQRDPNHHRVILAFSVAFWDAYLGASSTARGWLDGKAPANLLGKGDLWEHK